MPSGIVRIVRDMTDGEADDRPLPLPMTAPIRWHDVTLTVLATLVVGAVSTWINFDRLGADRMWGDEATYALIVDRIVASGDPFTLSFDGIKPYFDKPPLGIWLTAATYNLFGDEPSGIVRYRAWSAGFGVIAVMLTCVIGAAWCSPGVGLVAGLLLAMNGKYLLSHGARHGGFDTGLIVCCLGATLVYTAWIKQRVRPTFAWIAIGLAAGLASLFKPLAGVPFVLLLLIHAMCFVRHESRWRVLRGALIAVGICLLVWAPWHIYEWARFGQPYLDYFFGRNLAERIVHGIDPRHMRGAAFYWTDVPQSSGPFLFWPVAVVVLAIAAWRQRTIASATALLAIVSIGWIAIFSLSPSKFLHYAYPAFPFIAIALSAAMETAGQWMARRWPTVPVVAIGWVVVAVAVTANVVRLVLDTIPTKQSEYAPWVAYKALEPAIDAGNLRVVRYNVPRPPFDNNVAFYLSKMRKVTTVDSPDALAALLATPQPTLLLSWNPAGGLPANLVDGWRSRADLRYSADAHDLSLLALDVQSVTTPSLISSPATLPTFLPFTPMFLGDATLNVHVRFDGSSPPLSGHLEIHLAGRRSETSTVPINPSGQTFVLPVKVKASQVGQAQRLNVAFVPDDGSTASTTIAMLERLSIAYQPQAPVRPRVRE